MPKVDFNDVIGKRIERLVVVRYYGRAGNNGHPHYTCRCDCGEEKVVARTSILREATKSCGCLRNEKRWKHGGSYDNAYWSWKAMHKRCNDPSHDSYHRYGGRGIKVCERWHKYENFKQDMGERPKGVSIDRIDHNGDYGPENCKWSTSEEQSNNRSSNRIVLYEGERYTCSQLAHKFEIAPSVLNARLFSYNWPIEEALGLKKRHTQVKERGSDGRFKPSKGGGQMMTDRELLEKAARAIGMMPTGLWQEGMMQTVGGWTAWNPLENDGDALRLAVACGLTVCTDGATTVSACDYQTQDGVFVTQRLDECGGGKDAATRRAIVRAAAAMADNQ